jgi:hypothetical protein
MVNPKLAKLVKIDVLAELFNETSPPLYMEDDNGKFLEVQRIDIEKIFIGDERGEWVYGVLAS